MSVVDMTLMLWVSKLFRCFEILSCFRMTGLKNRSQGKIYMNVIDLIQSAQPHNFCLNYVFQPFQAFWILLIHFWSSCFRNEQIELWTNSSEQLLEPNFNSLTALFGEGLDVSINSSELEATFHPETSYQNVNIPTSAKYFYPLRAFQFSSSEEKSSITIIEIICWLRRNTSALNCSRGLGVLSSQDFKKFFILEETKSFASFFTLRITCLLSIMSLSGRKPTSF